MIKNLQIIFILIFLISSVTLGQTFVNPGDGTLSEAIAAAADGDVLLLAAGETYTETTGSNFGILTVGLTIEVDGDETSSKPLVQVLNSDELLDNKFFYLANGSSLTLRGIEFDGAIDGTADATNLVQYNVGAIAEDTKVGKILIDNCLIHDFTSNVIDGGSSSMMGWVVNDSIYINNTIIHNTRTIVYTKYTALKFLSITNSTFYNCDSYGLRIDGFGQNGILNVSTRGIIDHTTWYNWGAPSDGREMLLLEYGPNTEPWTVTNSIFQGQVNKGKTVINLKETTGDSLATITNICLWDVGKRVWKNHTLADTLFETYKPEFADPDNGDFTLAVGSELLTYGTDGSAIGDLRWAGNAPQVSVKPEDNSVPSSYQLGQNYPNPFNPSTVISFSLPKEGMTKLVVHDILGNEVATLLNENLSVGNYKIKFDASALPSGIYIYSLKSSQKVLSKKMMLLK